MKEKIQGYFTIEFKSKIDDEWNIWERYPIIGNKVCWMLPIRIMEINKKSIETRLTYQLNEGEEK